MSSKPCAASGATALRASGKRGAAATAELRPSLAGEPRLTNGSTTRVRSAPEPAPPPPPTNRGSPSFFATLPRADGGGRPWRGLDFARERDGAHRPQQRGFHLRLEPHRAAPRFRVRALRCDAPLAAPRLSLGCCAARRVSALCRAVQVWGLHGSHLDGAPWPVGAGGAGGDAGAGRVETPGEERPGGGGEEQGTAPGPPPRLLGVIDHLSAERGKP